MPSTRSDTRVTVLGAGRMGSALVKSFCSAGHGVTVWNRDLAKAEALVAVGANVALSAKEAVAASPLILICVADYASSRELLEPLKGDLAGKLVVQLTTGSPDEAEAFAEFLDGAGADSLDGAVMSYPKDVGQESCRILLSGDRRFYDHAEPVMRALGRPMLVGERPGAASAMDGALLFYAHTTAFAYFQSAALLMAQEYDWRGLAGQIAARPNDAETIEGWEAAIADHCHAGSEATLAVHFAAFTGIAAVARAVGVRHPLMNAVNDHFEQAVRAGFGGDELSAVFETFRPAARADSRRDHIAAAIDPMLTRG